MSDYVDFFLGSPASVVKLELVEVSHPAFSVPYRFVRNHAAGVTVDLSPAEQNVFFPYYPARISAIGAHDDLDAAIRVELGNLGAVLPEEIDAVEAAGRAGEKPMARFWVFRSDDLTGPILGPLILEITALQMNAETTSFEAMAPDLNNKRTGTRYLLEMFPTLRGFV